MIDGTFSFVPGMGPARERELWRKGVRTWGDFPAEGVVLAPAIDARIRAALPEMRGLLAAGRFAEMAARLPVREHWRFIPHVEHTAAYLDIETAPDGRVTVIGLYDASGGVRLFVRGHNLGAFLDERLPQALVTFNGAAFDVPVLRRTFPGFRPPPLHLDLRTVMRGLKERGGLKALEVRWGIERPEHLRGVGGQDAVTLWDAFARRRDVRALERLLEYNLYDVVQLRSLAQLACERLAAREGRSWSAPERFLRGDVLLDISRAVAGVTERAGRITPDQVHDEERLALRA